VQARFGRLAEARSNSRRSRDDIHPLCTALLRVRRVLVRPHRPVLGHKSHAESIVF
jgi:hypothetical protein